MFAIYHFLQGPECPVVYGGLQRLQKYGPACWANRGHLTSIAAVIWIKYHRRSSSIRSPNVTIYVKSLQILSEFERLLKDNWKEREAITFTLELAQVTYCLCEKHCSFFQQGFDRKNHHLKYRFWYLWQAFSQKLLFYVFTLLSKAIWH